MKKYYLAIVFFTIGCFAYSQEISTDRPDQSESSSLVPLHSLQIETGIIIQNTPNLSSNLLPTTLLRYGLYNSIELRLLTNYVSLKDKISSEKNSGFSDLEIGAKFQLKEKKNSNTEMAFLTHISLPTAKSEISTNNLGIINKFIVSHSIGEKSGIGYNVGYNYFGLGNGNLTYTLSFSTNLTDKLFWYIEPYGALNNLISVESNFDTGIAYKLKDNLQIDFSYGVGLNNTMNFIAFGCSWNLGNL